MTSNVQKLRSNLSTAVQNSIKRQRFEHQFKTNQLNGFTYLFRQGNNYQHGYSDLFYPDRNNWKKYLMKIENSDSASLFEFLDQLFLTKEEIQRRLIIGGKRIRQINQEYNELIDRLIERCRLKLDTLDQSNVKYEQALVTKAAWKLANGSWSFASNSSIQELEQYLTISYWLLLEIIDPYLLDGKWDDDENKLGAVFNYLRYETEYMENDLVSKEAFAKIILECIPISKLSKDPVQSVRKGFGNSKKAKEYYSEFRKKLNLKPTW